MRQLSHFSSLEAAKILGVNVSSIKRWTEEGKLQCIKSAGGHRKFLLHHLAGFLDKNKKIAAKASLFPVDSIDDLQISHYILQGEFDYLQTYVLDLAFSFQRNRILKVLQGLYLAQHDLAEIYDKLLVPILHEVGRLWESGQISISEEHIASQNIRDSLVRLQAVIHIPAAQRGVALCLSFSTDLHDIALKMVDHILEAQGYKVLFSGALTPLMNIESLLISFQPRHVYLSSTLVENKAQTQKEFDHIVSLCHKHRIDLFLGGTGFLQIDIKANMQNRVIPNFTALEKSLQK